VFLLLIESFNTFLEQNQYNNGFWDVCNEKCKNVPIDFTTCVCVHVKTRELLREFHEIYREGLLKFVQTWQFWLHLHINNGHYMKTYVCFCVHPKHNAPNIDQGKVCCFPTEMIENSVTFYAQYSFCIKVEIATKICHLQTLWIDGRAMLVHTVCTLPYFCLF
jgi:hypothetical protein